MANHHSSSASVPTKLPPKLPLTLFRTYLALLLFILSPSLAVAQAVPPPGPPNPVVGEYLYKNITADTTTIIKSGPGILHTVCINTPAATETLTIYDNTAASGTEIATITVYASTNPCFTYDVVFNTGLTIVSSTAAGNVTVSYQ